MPKVYHVKARKDYPKSGIKKGDMCYVWSIKMQRGGRDFRSLHPPRQSQLTMSDYKVAAHQINEALDDLDTDDADELQGAVETAVSDAESLRDEQQEKLDNMPEGFQQGQTGELLQERIEALEAFIDELQALDFDDAPDPEDDDAFEVDGDASKDAGQVLNSDGQTQDEWRAEQQEAARSEWIEEKRNDIGGIRIEVN